MAINKVVINDIVKLDLTEDIVTPDKLAKGVTAHNSAGELIIGTMSSGSSISYGQIIVGTTWTKSGDYYTQDISASDIANTDHIIVDVLLSDDSNTAQQELINYDLIQKIKILDGKLVIYAVKETTMQITLMIEVKKDG